MWNPKLDRLSRRELVRAGALGASAAALLGAIEETEAQVPRSYAYYPFRMGVQSYSLRGFGFEDALEKTRKFGLHYWESFQAHVPQHDSAEKAKLLLQTFVDAKIRLMAWGVQGFDGDEAKARKVFEFAKLMKIDTITADPTREALPVLDRLVQEFKINIGIHNHGPGSRYDKIADVEQAVNGRNWRLGVCVDTGHFLRSGEDPVEAVRRFGKRVHSVHLKDVRNKTTFTVLGEGDLRLVDCIRELRKQSFDGILALEYEENPQDPIADIARCLAASEDAIRKVRGNL